jgi:hypothetical protein
MKTVASGFYSMATADSTYESTIFLPILSASAATQERIGRAFG